MPSVTADADSALQVALLEDDAMLRERILLPGLAFFGFVVTGMEKAAELERHPAVQRADIVVLTSACRMPPASRSRAVCGRDSPASASSCSPAAARRRTGCAA